MSAKEKAERAIPYRAIAALMTAAMLSASIVPILLRGVKTDTILLIAIVVTGLPLAFDLLRQIVRKNWGVDLLAIISVVCAVLFHEYWVAAIVILMLSGGKALEEYATRKASSVLGALARRMPSIAHKIGPDGSIVDLRTENIQVGDLLSIYPHELCPVDGVVVSGDGTMDESYLTGEPFMIGKAPGATVLSGAINGQAALTVRATRVATDSRYARIVEVLHTSEETRPRIRRLGERFGVWYTPACLAIAGASWAFSGDPDRFLAVLVIATPCPLLLAIPVAIIGAISVGARRGIIVKDPSVLEKVGSCQTLIVDKTGTLTYGKPVLTDVVCSGAWTRRTVLQLAASLERYSKHPLGPAVIAAAEEEGVSLLAPADVFEIPGQGLRADIDGHVVMLTGRKNLPERLAKPISDLPKGLECVALIDGELAGLLRFQDEPRAESKPFLQHLRLRHRIRKVVLLSGDRPSEVARFAERMGITQEFGGKSPEEKVAIVRDLTSAVSTLYIGDGMNDAPAMMNATAGIALGVNSEITSEAAGAVILQSSLESVDELIHIGDRMRRIAITSAVGGMALSLVGMGGSALGYITPVQGAILQELIDLLAILNSLRMILPSGQIGDFKPPRSAAPVRTRGASPVPASLH